MKKLSLEREEYSKKVRRNNIYWLVHCILTFWLHKALA